jgi:hypothetical protein
VHGTDDDHQGEDRRGHSGKLVDMTRGQHEQGDHRNVQARKRRNPARRAERAAREPDPQVVLVADRRVALTSAEGEIVEELAVSLGVTGDGGVIGRAGAHHQAGEHIAQQHPAEDQAQDEPQPQAGQTARTGGE